MSSIDERLTAIEKRLRELEDKMETFLHSFGLQRHYTEKFFAALLDTETGQKMANELEEKEKAAKATAAAAAAQASSS